MYDDLTGQDFGFLFTNYMYRRFQLNGNYSIFAFQIQCFGINHYQMPLFAQKEMTVNQDLTVNFSVYCNY